MFVFSDCILLILYSFLALFFIPAKAGFLAAFLCTLMILCGSYAFENQKIRLLFYFIFGGLSLLIPEFILFYPCFFYLLFREQLPALVVPAFVIFLYVMPVWGENSRFLVAAGIFGMVLAFFMEQNTKERQELTIKLRRTRDDSMERNLLLAQKNKALLEKQDYEIYNATLRERNRIAREIHDNVGHVLSRSILMVAAAKTINKETGTASLLEKLEESLNSAMNSIRSSVHDLHDEAVNLEEVEKSLVSEFTFCQADLTYDMSRVVPREVKYCFISITKEALANVIRHSNATKVSVIVREHPALYQLCIRDNGTAEGFGQRQEGIGIANMKERVNALNGTIQITAKNGFRIFITIPK